MLGFTAQWKLCLNMSETNHPEKAASLSTSHKLICRTRRWAAQTKQQYERQIKKKKDLGQDNNLGSTKKADTAVTYLQAHPLVIKNPFLCCEPQLTRVVNVSLASCTSIAVVTVAVEGQDSTIAERLRRAAGPQHRRTDSRKACHQAA